MSYHPSRCCMARCVSNRATQGNIWADGLTHFGLPMLLMCGSQFGGQSHHPDCEGFAGGSCPNNIIICWQMRAGCQLE